MNPSKEYLEHMGEKSSPRKNTPARLIATAAIAGGLVTGCAQPNNNQPSEAMPRTTPVTIPTPESFSWQSEQLLPGEQFLAGKEAGQIAKRLGISANSFFLFPTGEAFWQQSEIKNALSNPSILQDYDNYHLPPVFPPSVLKWQKEIKAAVQSVYQQTNTFVPPEVIAIIMTAESSGLSGVNSPEPKINDIGIGLMQVLRSNMETYILKQAVLGDNMDTSNETVYNPMINTLIGTHMIADAIKAVSSQYPQSNINYGPFLANVIAYYNGGPNAINLSIPELMKQPGYSGTVIYRDDSQRFLMSCAIANQLKLAGFTDSQIVDQMSSTQVDAKAYALNILLVRRGTDSAYNQILDEVTRPQDFPEAAQLIQEYVDNPIWITPQNPALRIFCKRGGDWLFLQSDENTDPKFYHMTPKQIRQYQDSQTQYIPHETKQQRDQRRGYSTPKI